jgi:hypothetical protein
MSSSWCCFVLLAQVGTLFSVFQPDITKADLTPIGPLVVALIERELQLEDLPLDTFGSLRSKELQIAKTADRSAAPIRSHPKLSS